LDDRLNPEKLEALREWAVRLRDDERPELVAAGRAIQLLLAEIGLLRRRAALGADVAGGPELSEIWARPRERESGSDATASREP
jgi:hypothetical protein